MRIETKNSCHLMQINGTVREGLLPQQMPQGVTCHQIAAVNILVLAICIIGKHKLLAFV